MTKAVGFFALVWLNVPLLVRSNQPADPMGCATDMSNLVEVITTASADITFSTSDCTPPGLDELDCSADIVDAIKKLSEVAQTISSATFNCGGVNNNCAVAVLSVIVDATDVGNNLIAAAADCQQAPFNCIVVFESINSAMAVAVDIYTAVQDCNPTPVNQYNPEPMTETPDDMLSYDAAVQSLGLDPLDPSLPVERRLAGGGPVQAPGQRPPGQTKGGETKRYRYRYPLDLSPGAF